MNIDMFELEKSEMTCRRFGHI